MNRDVIDFNEKVYQTALELAEARCASEDVLQGLTMVHEFTKEALKDADMMKRFADLLTEGTQARSLAADTLTFLRGHSFRLITESIGHLSGRRVSPDGSVTHSREFMTVRVLHSGDVWLEVFGDYSVTLKDLRLPCVGMLVHYYSSYSSSRKYVYSLWVTAYIKVLAQNILRYNLPTSIPFMDEEG